MLRTLRQPRYLALSALMLVVALVCVAAGTWQIYRFDQKVRENHALRLNATLPTVPVKQLLPLVGRPLPSHYDYEYRTVRATGHYDAAHQTFVRNRTVGGVTGFLALTPFDTADGTLLIVRGFAGPGVDGRAPTPPAPPAGTVTVVARLEPAETNSDAFAQLANGQVESINPADQQARLGGHVFDGYGQLLPGQPGAQGLRSLGAPNMSNPAGGALEPQHFAYIIQWYLFALLAVAAPFAMARAENKLRRDGDIDSGDIDSTVDSTVASAGSVRDAPPAHASLGAGTDRPAVAVAPELTPEERRAAKLADRYGRPVR